MIKIQSWLEYSARVEYFPNIVEYSVPHFSTKITVELWRSDASETVIDTYVIER